MEMENENIYTEKEIASNGNKETNSNCINITDVKSNKLPVLMNKNNSSEDLTNYQFSDDEIKFYSDDNYSKSIYSPESSYTNDDFKNLLGWVPRNLIIGEPICADSIPCAFFFSNDNKYIKNDKIILYLHKFNEDLGIAIPTISGLHKKLNINIIAMEYSGYGVSFDNFEQKLVSIVNDTFTILKFIINFLKIPYNNIFIVCYEFLASCAIEVVNRFEYIYGKNIPLGGIIMIKPQFLEMINNYKNDSTTTKYDIICNTITRNNLIDGYDNCNNEEDVIVDDKTMKACDSNNKALNKKKNTSKFKKSHQIDSYVIEKEKKKNNMKNRNYHDENKIKEQETHENIQKSKKKKYIEKINLNKKQNDINNNNKECRNIFNTNYDAYNGVITCDMSIFYSNNTDKINENVDIPYILMKRILKDTFDINHSINSIKTISCSILIFHPENYSYKNSCSHILLTNAKQCFKKAAFSFEFMNEDFIAAFKWFFSQNCDFQKKEKLFKNLLYLYIDPKYNNNEYNKNDADDNINNDIDKILNNTFSVGLSNHFNNSFNNNIVDDINDNSGCNNRDMMCIPDEIFICPEIIQKVHN